MNARIEDVRGERFVRVLARIPVGDIHSVGMAEGHVVLNTTAVDKRGERRNRILTAIPSRDFDAMFSLVKDNRAAPPAGREVTHERND